MYKETQINSNGGQQCRNYFFFSIYTPVKHYLLQQIGNLCKLGRHIEILMVRRKLKLFE